MLSSSSATFELSSPIQTSASLPLPSILGFTLNATLPSGDAYGVSASIGGDQSALQVIPKSSSDGALVAGSLPENVVLEGVRLSDPHVLVNISFELGQSDVSIGLDAESPFMMSLTQHGLPTSPFGLTLGSAKSKSPGSLVLGGYDPSRVHDRLYQVQWPSLDSTIENVTVSGAGNQIFTATLSSNIDVIEFPAITPDLQQSIRCQKDLTFTFVTTGSDNFSVDVPLGGCSESESVVQFNQFDNPDRAVALGLPFLQAAYLLVDGGNIYLGRAVLVNGDVIGKRFVASSFESPSVGSDSTSTKSPSKSTSTSQSTTALVPPTTQAVSQKKPNVGAIAGGVVGGLVGLALLILAFLLLCRRRTSKNRSNGYETSRGEMVYRGTGMSSSSSPTTYDSQYMHPPKSYEPVPTVTECAPAMYNSQPVGQNVQHQSHYSDQQNASYDTRPIIHAPIPIRAEVSLPAPAMPAPVGPNELDSREVNEDGVSVRSLSPDPDMDARLGSYQGPTPTPEAQAARGHVARLPLASRTKDD